MAQVPLGKPDFGMPAVENAKISPAAARRGYIAKKRPFYRPLNKFIIPHRYSAVNKDVLKSFEFYELHEKIKTNMVMFPSCRNRIFRLSYRYRKGVSPMIM